MLPTYDGFPYEFLDVVQHYCSKGFCFDLFCKIIYGNYHNFNQPSVVRKGPNKSIPHQLNGHDNRISFCSAEGWHQILVKHQHLSQLHTNCSTSCFILDQQYPNQTALRVTDASARWLSQIPSCISLSMQLASSGARQWSKGNAKPFLYSWSFSMKKIHQLTFYFLCFLFVSR